ncbi:DHHC palmitoyltransferase-domain-containing protein [Zopfochytrium polystomum]|nr:DHHC palmitoyltransferase-domain-containing protein [Zopfochytrium polystomum]
MDGRRPEEEAAAAVRGVKRPLQPTSPPPPPAPLLKFDDGEDYRRKSNSNSSRGAGGGDGGGRRRGGGGGRGDGGQRKHRAAGPHSHHQDHGHDGDCNHDDDRHDDEDYDDDDDHNDYNDEVDDAAGAEEVRLASSAPACKAPPSASSAAGAARKCRWELWQGRAAVAVTLFLISFIPYTTQTYIFYPWLAFISRETAILWLAPFDLAVLSIWVNYALACWTDPGRVPKDYYPPVNGVGGGGDGANGDSTAKQKTPIVLQLRKTNAGLRTCPKCKVYKPPRSHHCSVCRRCVLKMDHHCPWLNNCVGHRNLGYFIRFIYSVVLASGYCLFLIARRMLAVIRYQNQIYKAHLPNADYYFTPPPSNTELVYMVVNVVLLLILLLLVGFLSMYQMHYSTSNTTTIEYMENSKIDTLVRRGKIRRSVAYPYDLGAWANLHEVFGGPFLLWWLPLRPRGDGLSFKVNAEAAAEAAESGGVVTWPPKEYFRYKSGSTYPVSDDSDLATEDDSDDDLPDSPTVVVSSHDGEGAYGPSNGGVYPNGYGGEYGQGHVYARGYGYGSVPSALPLEGEEGGNIYRHYDGGYDPEGAAVGAGYGNPDEDYEAQRWRQRSSRVRVRRGSEGYIVREITAADRERMVEEEMRRTLHVQRAAAAAAASTAAGASATATAGLEGPAAGSDGGSQSEAGSDSEADAASDDELLAAKQERYRSLGLVSAPAAADGSEGADDRASGGGGPRRGGRRAVEAQQSDDDGIRRRAVGAGAGAAR